MTTSRLQSPEAWLNGHPADPALACCRGLHYGDGVFRTILKYNSHFIDISHHLEKLVHDAKALDMDAPTLPALTENLHRAGGTTRRAVLKLMLMRKAGRRGYAPSTRAVDSVVWRFSAPRYPAAHWSKGVCASDSSVHLSTQPLLAGIKHLNRLEQVLASRDWPSGVDEVILHDVDGYPVCGSRSNLFWTRGQVLYTPDLRRCGVAGVMRDKVLATAERAGFSCRVGRHTRRSLERADEIFFTNSLIGIWPLRSWNGRTRSAPGPITRRLMDSLAHPRLT